MQTIVVDIPLSVSLETKTDPKQSQGAQILENVRFDETGVIQKRYGYETLPVNVFSKIGSTNGAPTLASGHTIINEGKRLVIYGKSTDTTDLSDSYGHGIFHELDQNKGWSEHTRYTPVSWKMSELSNYAVSYKNPSALTAGGITVVAFDSNGERTKYPYNNKTTNYSVFDGYTGASYQEGITLSSTGNAQPKIFYLENRSTGLYRFHIYWLVGSKIKLTIIDPANPETAGTTYAILSNVHSDGLWDACLIEKTNDYIIVSTKDTSNRIQLVAINYLGAPLASIVTTITTPENCLGIWEHNDRVFVGYEKSNVIYCSVYDIQLINIYIDQKITDIDATAHNITSTFDSSTGYQRIFIEVEYTADDVDYRRKIVTQKFDYDGLEVTEVSETYMHHMGLASKAWSYDNNAYVLGVHSDNIDAYQSGYFMLSCAPGPPDLAKDLFIISASILKSRAGYIRNKGLSEVNVLSNDSTKFNIALMRGEKNASEQRLLQGVVLLEIDMAPESMPHIRLGNIVISGGGVIQAVNGLGSELGFHLKPRMPIFASVGSTGGSLSDGTYYFRLMYEVIDFFGNVHRSAPGNPFAVLVGNGTSTSKISFFAEHTSCTDWTTRRDNRQWGNNISIIIYRNPGGSNETIYYRDQEQINNVQTFATASFSDNDSDIVLKGNEILYTESGETHNTAPPGSKILIANNKRAFLVPFDDLETVWYSKEKQDGLTIEFSESLQIRTTGADIQGLGIMDQNIFVFKKHEIHILRGEGYSKTLQGTNFIASQIATSVGCINHKSIVEVPMGIIFKSTKGIYLLSKSLQTQYIGAPVEKYNSHKIVAAVPVPTANQVRFILDSTTTSTPTHLVYDYLQNRWAVSVGTGLAAVDATLNASNSFCWLKQTGVVCKETTTAMDSNSYITMKVRTPWLKLRGLQGYQRAKRIALLGEFRSDHTLNIKVFTNYNDKTAVQTITYDTTAKNYSVGDVLEIKAGLNNQKCSSIAFEIWDSNQSGSGESLKLTSIALDIGIKKGINKLPDALA